MKTNTGPCEIARASIRLYWTPTDGYERALLAPLNAHHGWSGDPRVTPSEALTKATWRAMTGQTVAVIAVLHADGSYRFAIPSEPSPPDAAALVTEAELAEVERLDREATPGPWDADGIHVWDQDGPSHVAEMHTSADARFVGRARATQPRLAAEVRRLTAGLDTARRETADVYAELEGVRAKNLRAVKALDEAQRERDEYRAEVAERDAQIARLARESDATDAALRAQIEAAENLAADRLASLDFLHRSIGNVLRGAGVEPHTNPAEMIGQLAPLVKPHTPPWEAAEERPRRRFRCASCGYTWVGAAPPTPGYTCHGRPLVDEGPTS